MRSECHLKHIASAVRVCVCARVCARVSLQKIRDPRIPTRCCFNEINQKDRKSKHFVLRDKMSFCFAAIIGCFLIRDYRAAILLCA